MHVFFSGIGGTAIGPLAIIAKQAGYEVSGSDKQDSQYVQYLSKFGIDINIGQDPKNLEMIHKNSPIDWFVYSSALPLENPNHPELLKVNELGIKNSKRDLFLSEFINNHNLKLIAFAGTHGKTTSTAMAVWVFKQLNIPVSYSVGAKINFGNMAEYNPMSEYFVYECDEFDHNFLHFKPYISVLSKVDWDHQDIYPTRDSYIRAFKDFCHNSAKIFAHPEEVKYLNISNETNTNIIGSEFTINLIGKHNRNNAAGVASAISYATNTPINKVVSILENYPGSNRRFEKLSDNIYSDYAHTPEEIESTIQMAKELSKEIAVIYEPLTNMRQYFIKDRYKDIFINLKSLYWVPSYLARENPNQRIIEPQEFVASLADSANAKPANLNDELKTNIQSLANNGVLCIVISGGGGGSLDEWARQQFKR
ncbi:MAG: Mur ligase domain-containing protein [Patescibacteria group bacterium]|nr:Mur ligase domain-containing protein [Patescibacteria group bacterium]